MLDGRCPACGLPVERSVFRRLSDQPFSYLRSVRRGLTLALSGYLALLMAPAALLVGALSLSPANSLVLDVIAALMLLLTGLGLLWAVAACLVGWWMASRLPPALARLVAGRRSPRRMLRSLILLNTILSVASITAGVAELVQSTPSTARMLQTLVVIWAIFWYAQMFLSLPLLSFWASRAGNAHERDRGAVVGLLMLLAAAAVFLATVVEPLLRPLVNTMTLTIVADLVAVCLTFLVVVCYIVLLSKVRVVVTNSLYDAEWSEKHGVPREAALGQRSAPPSGASGQRHTLEEDVACLACAANVRGQDVGGVCRDCGLAIERTLDPTPPCSTSATFLEVASRAAASLAVVAHLVLVGLVLLFITGKLTNAWSGSWPQHLRVVIGGVIAPLVVTKVGVAWRRFGAPDPSHEGGDFRRNAQRLRRWASGALVAVWIASVGSGILQLLGQVSPRVVSGVYILLVGIWIAPLALSIRHGRLLAGRIQNVDIEVAAATATSDLKLLCLWGGAACLGLAAFALVPFPSGPSGGLWVLLMTLAAVAGMGSFFTALTLMSHYGTLMELLSTALHQDRLLVLSMTGVEDAHK